MIDWLDVPQQQNPTPSSVSGIQIEENPPSRASVSRKYQSKSPAAGAATVTPREAKQKTQESVEAKPQHHQVKAKEKSAHEKKSTPLPPTVQSHKSKSQIDTKSIKSQQGAAATNEKAKLPSIVPKQKTDMKIPNRIKRQVSESLWSLKIFASPLCLLSLL